MDAVQSVTFEIFVVDNASSDDSCEAVSTCFPSVTLIKNSKNRGFAEANNQALLLATGKYCLLVNSDAFVEIDTIKKLIEFLNLHLNAAAVGPMVINFDGSLQSAGNSFPSVSKAMLALFAVHLFFPRRLLELIFPRIYWSADKAAKVDWVSGCCLMVRKSAVEELGLLSPDFFMYCEEVEWCFRAQRKGYDIWYIPTASVIHKNQSSPMGNRASILNKSRRIYFEKTVGRKVGIAITSLTLVSALLKYPLKMAIAKFRGKPADNSLWLGVVLEVNLIRDLVWPKNESDFV